MPEFVEKGSKSTRGVTSALLAALFLAGACGGDSDGTTTSPTPPTIYRLGGTILRSVVPSMPSGTPYSATLTFDPTEPITSPDPFGGVRYSFSSAAFLFEASTVRLNSTNIAISIDNGVNTDAIRINGDSLTGSFPAILRINLVDVSGSVLSSNAFPDPFPTRTDFSSTQLLINTSVSNIASLDIFEPAR